MNQFIHFILGAAAGAALKNCIRGAEVIAMQDWLSLGPLPPINNPKEWDDRRNAYWKEYFYSSSPFDIGDYSKLTASSTEIDKETKIVLWLGPSLNEQLFFLWVVPALQGLSIDLRNILFVPTYEYFPEIYNLGGLSPENFLHLVNEARALPDTSLILKTWQCICSSVPQWDLCASSVAAHYPLLANRLKLMKRHFPSSNNGLDIWTQRLLHAVESSGPRSIDVIGEMISSYRQEPDSPSDGLLSARLLQLANKGLPHPLLAVEGELPIRKLAVKLTTAGIRVLQSELSNITFNGINDWVAGVHLQAPPGPVWYYDEDQDNLILK